MRRTLALRLQKKKGAKIVELFFDGDRNEIGQGPQDRRWRIIVWDAVVGNRDIDPDAPFFDARPGKEFSRTEGTLIAREVAKELASEYTVYVSDVIPASKVVDTKEDNCSNVTKRTQHRFLGSNSEVTHEWQQREDYKPGQSGSCGEGDIMR